MHVYEHSRNHWRWKPGREISIEQNKNISKDEEFSNQIIEKLPRIDCKNGIKMETFSSTDFNMKTIGWKIYGQLVLMDGIKKQNLWIKIIL